MIGECEFYFLNCKAEIGAASLRGVLKELRDSSSFGQFDILKSPKSQYGLMGDLSSDQSELYLGHGLVLKFQHKLHK